MCPTPRGCPGGPGGPQGGPGGSGGPPPGEGFRLRPMWTSAGSRAFEDFLISRQWSDENVWHSGVEVWLEADAGSMAALVDALYGVPREYSSQDALSIELP